MMSKGKPLDFEQADPEIDTFGVGKVEDFSWNGHARHGDLHRVRPLPEPVPGVEHRQAAVARSC